MNRGLELHSGGILSILSHALNGKYFHLIVKTKQKKVGLNSCSHGNTFWDESLYQNSAKHLKVLLQRGRVWPPVNGRKNIYSKQILCIQLDTFAPFTHVSLLELHIPEFLTTALRDHDTSTHPLFSMLPFLSSASLKLIKATSLTVFLILPP